MALENTSSRLAILPVCLAAALAALGCGDDPATTDEHANFPSTADEPNPAAAGATSTNNTPGPQSSGDKPDAASSKPEATSGKDAGVENADAGSVKPSGESGNTIYMGAPECPKIGRKIGGTVEGKPVAYALADLSKTTDTTFEAEESGVDRGRIELEWEPALAPGKTSKIIDGTLKLPSTYEMASYCVIDGLVQADARLPESMGSRLYATITKVKKQVNLKCEGAELVADLKLCSMKP